MTLKVNYGYFSGVGGIAGNVLQISEGTNSVGIVRLNLGFCLCAVIGSCRVNYKHLVEVNDMLQ